MQKVTKSYCYSHQKTHQVSSAKTQLILHLITILIPSPWAPPFKNKNCENIRWDPNFTQKKTHKNKLSHLCRFGIGEANGYLFKKVCFCKRLRATTKSCWWSSRDAEITGIKQLYFRVKKIFTGLESSIYTKNTNKTMTCAPSLTSSEKNVYCTSLSAVRPT